MENVIAERAKSASLTKSQRKIAEFFIRNPERIVTMSSQDAARETGVSDASIIRFSRAIGYEGYADLKSDIYRSLLRSAGTEQTLSERMSQNRDKYGSGPEPFLELMQVNAYAAFRNNSAEDFDRIADLLIESENRYVLGPRGCKGIAAQFGRTLSFMLPHVYTLSGGAGQVIETLRDLSASDTVILFVFSRFYKADLHYAKLIRERGAKLILITDDVTGPLSAYADIVLIAATANTSFYHSTFGTVLIGEYILNLVSSKVDCRARIDEYDRITKDQRL